MDEGGVSLSQGSRVGLTEDRVESDTRLLTVKVEEDNDDDDDVRSSPTTP